MDIAWITSRPERPQSSAAKDPSPLSARLLSGMRSDVAESFTETQLSAIERALEERSPSKPGLDLRLSIPLFRRRYFFVLFGGSDKRSPERLRRDRSAHPLWTMVNISALSFVFVLLIPVALGLSHMIVTLAAY